MRLRGRFTQEFASRTSIGDLRSLLGRVQQQFGVEVERLSERLVPQGENQVYVRVSRFSATGALVEWSLVLDPSGSIVDMRIRLGETP
jgi:hypothetical protein